MCVLSFSLLRAPKRRVAEAQICKFGWTAAKNCQSEKEFFFRALFRQRVPFVFVVFMVLDLVYI